MRAGKCSLDRVPVIADAHAYGSEWVRWWTAVQPKERDVQQWPFLRGTNGDVNWDRFPANGKDGIFLALISLSWWAPAVQSPDEIVFFEEAVTNIHWVIQYLIHFKTTLQLPPLRLTPSQDEVNTSQAGSIHHQPNPTSCSPASSSHPPESTSGAYAHQRATGKRVVKPTWKAQTTS